jgi:SAM-dependent MidA family methyltransferase
MEIDATRLGESNPVLVDIIRAEIIASGAIPFARFMELALYHPEHGYYSVERAGPGRSGDFITAPEAHPIFGQLIARQLIEMDERLGQPAPFTVREYGAGRGALAIAVLDELREHAPDCYQRTRYEPVEVNAVRIAEFARDMNEHGHGRRVGQVDYLSPISGCILANEFLDAFPVHRITGTDRGLQEIFVAWREGWFAEELRAISSPRILEYLDRHGFNPGPGETVEVNLAVQQWMRDVAQPLDQGYALFIDYGYPAADLYAGHRQDGTLRAYYRHGATDEVYRGIGMQDLTAHVNFTEVEFQAMEHGLTIVGSTTQDQFLAALGMGDLLVSMQQQEGMTAESYLAARAAAMRLIDPGSMGRFRVLIMARNAPVDPPLRGLLPVT